MSDENTFKGLNTICTHVGQVKDEQYGGSVSPIYPGTSYEYCLLYTSDAADD